MWGPSKCEWGTHILPVMAGTSCAHPHSLGVGLPGQGWAQGLFMTSVPQAPATILAWVLIDSLSGTVRMKVSSEASNFSHTSSSPSSSFFYFSSYSPQGHITSVRERPPLPPCLLQTLGLYPPAFSLPGPPSESTPARMG